MEGHGLTVLVGLFVVCLLIPVGADRDDEDDERFKSNDGDYECFYDVGKHQDLRFLGAMYCKHGCCGYTHEQRCCSKEEKEKKEHKLSGTMVILAATFGSIVAIIIVSVVIYCCCKKNAEKKQSKYTNNTGRQNDLFTVMEMGATAPRAPAPAPPVTGFPYPRETKETKQNFMANAPPYDTQNPRSNAPHDTQNAQNEAASFPVSPPPPYSE